MARVRLRQPEKKKKTEETKKQPPLGAARGAKKGAKSPKGDRWAAGHGFTVVKVRRIINKIWHIVAIAADIYYVSIGFGFCDYEILPRPI